MTQFTVTETRFFRGQNGHPFDRTSIVNGEDGLFSAVFDTMDEAEEWAQACRRRFFQLLEGEYQRPAYEAVPFDKLSRPMRRSLEQSLAEFTPDEREAMIRDSKIRY